MRFGVHTGLQHTTYDVLRPAWRKIEDLGFDWISIWDHFYGATGKPDDAPGWLVAVANSIVKSLGCCNGVYPNKIVHAKKEMPDP